MPRASADLLLAKTRRLLQPSVGLQELGFDLDALGFDVGVEGFRLGRTRGYGGERPEIILCAEGAYPSASENILELRIEALPVGYLLRAL